MKIAELIKELGEVKFTANEFYKNYKLFKEKEDNLKNALIAELDNMGLKSAKGEKYSAILVQRSDIEITHEQSVIDWLKHEPNVEADAYIGIKRTEFKTLAKQVLKETGEIIPGTETIHKESLTIKENK